MKIIETIRQELVGFAKGAEIMNDRLDTRHALVDILISLINSWSKQRGSWPGEMWVSRLLLLHAYSGTID